MTEQPSLNGGGPFSDDVKDGGDRICKYFVSGKCRNGDMCPWLHPGKLNQNWNQRQQQGKAITHGKPIAQNKTICRYFLNGNCKNGANCVFLHEVAPINDGLFLNDFNQEGSYEDVSYGHEETYEDDHGDEYDGEYEEQYDQYDDHSNQIISQPDYSYEDEAEDMDDYEDNGVPYQQIASTNYQPYQQQQQKNWPPKPQIELREVIYSCIHLLVISRRILCEEQRLRFHKIRNR